MDNVKGVFASRTVWAGIIGLVAAGLNLAGFDLSAQDQATLADLALGIVSALAAFGAIWGRVAATKRLK